MLHNNAIRQGPSRTGRAALVLKLAILAGLMLLIWSTLFASTYRYPFHWDDFHVIRQYSLEELRSTFHGWDDPDKIETPALRPLAALFFALQGSVFGEDVVLQRIFMTALMWSLLVVLGLFLSELGCSVFQVGLVFLLFVFSRVFASLNLWLTLGSLIFCYIFMLLTGYWFLLWVKRRRILYLVLVMFCTTVAVFVREEAYVLPIALPIVWAISSPDWRDWRRPVGAALGVFGIVTIHFALRTVFVPEAPPPQFTISAADMLLTTVKASWLPCGYETRGPGDRLIADLWIGFLVGLFLVFARMSRSRSFWQLAGICCLGCVLCLPAIGMARSFGIAMSTLAFMATIPVAIGEVYHQIRSVELHHKWRLYTFASYVFVGLTVGIAGGIHRSLDVADSFHENCAVRVLRDGELIFELSERHVTIPEKRREAGRARLAAVGIYTVEDLGRLSRDVHEHPENYERNRKSREALFLSKYDYMTF